jgi:hypothetical protein
MTQAVPKHRWLQFGLRTMFVAVTVFAVFVGYHLNWIRQRHEFHRSVDAIWRFPDPESTAPGLLWMFGESGLTGSELLISQQFNDVGSIKRHLLRIFPEDDWTLVTTDDDGNFVEHGRAQSLGFETDAP